MPETTIEDRIVDDLLSDPTTDNLLSGAAPEVLASLKNHWREIVASHLDAEPTAAHAEPTAAPAALPPAIVEQLEPAIAIVNSPAEAQPSESTPELSEPATDEEPKS